MHRRIRLCSPRISRPPSRIIPPHTGNREVICRHFPIVVSPISAACSMISKRPHLHTSQALPSTFSHHHSCLVDPLKRSPAKKAKPSDTPDTRTFQVVGDLTNKECNLTLGIASYPLNSYFPALRPAAVQAAGVAPCTYYCRP